MLRLLVDWNLTRLQRVWTWLKLIKTKMTASHKDSTKTKIKTGRQKQHYSWPNVRDVKLNVTHLKIWQRMAVNFSLFLTQSYHMDLWCTHMDYMYEICTFWPWHVYGSCFCHWINIFIKGNCNFYLTILTFLNSQLQDIKSCSVEKNWIAHDSDFIVCQSQNCEI